MLFKRTDERFIITVLSSVFTLSPCFPNDSSFDILLFGRKKIIVIKRPKPEVWSHALRALMKRPTIATALNVLRSTIDNFQLTIDHRCRFGCFTIYHQRFIIHDLRSVHFEKNSKSVFCRRKSFYLLGKYWTF